MAIIRIARGHHVQPETANFAQIPNLFGVAVYSFMCQHSLPGKQGPYPQLHTTYVLHFHDFSQFFLKIHFYLALVTPINNKRRVTWMLVCDFMVVLCFYLLLSITAAFCFDVTVMQVCHEYISNLCPKMSFFYAFF